MTRMRIQVERDYNDSVVSSRPMIHLRYTNNNINNYRNQQPKIVQQGPRTGLSLVPDQVALAAVVAAEVGTTAAAAVFGTVVIVAEIVGMVAAAVAGNMQVVVVVAAELAGEESKPVDSARENH